MQTDLGPSYASCILLGNFSNLNILWDKGDYNT